MARAIVVAGVFGSIPAARHAEDRLVEAGIPRHIIVLSLSLTEDGIAGEAPGQSYENQPGQPPEEIAWAHFAEKVRSGSCLLSVKARARGEKRNAEILMRQSGARYTAEPPA